MYIKEPTATLVERNNTWTIQMSEFQISGGEELSHIFNFFDTPKTKSEIFSFSGMDQMTFEQLLNSGLIRLQRGIEDIFIKPMITLFEPLRSIKIVMKILSTAISRNRFHQLQRRQDFKLAKTLNSTKHGNVDFRTFKNYQCEHFNQQIFSRMLEIK